jgi:hypothetical protein
MYDWPTTQPEPGNWDFPGVLTCRYVRLLCDALYWKTYSSGTSKTWAMRKATSRDGEYLLPSMALTV